MRPVARRGAVQNRALVNPLRHALSPSPPVLLHIAFYRFVRLPEPARVAQAVRALTRDLLGSVLVASEGINGVLAGDAAALDRFEHALRGDPAFDGAFAGLAFRRSACRTPPFQRIKVHLRSEILPLGVDGVDAVGRRGLQLDPAQWRALLADRDTVVIDNRNHFEHRLGRFRGAIDPQVGNFRDLPAFIAAHAPGWRDQGRRVAMYCTGGIRCEKTAAWMEDAFGLQVQQLEGGILRYLADTSNPCSNQRSDEPADAASDWQGECFVFDNRIALDARLQETATTAVEVYAGQDGRSDEAWRLQRAQRLAGTST
jgi:UPF0176 protein